MQERLQKVLSQWGIASRRRSEQLIQAGRVRVNGEVAVLGQKADPGTDVVTIDGQIICSDNRPELHYLLLHKPLGMVSTCFDPQGRKTVIDTLSVPLQSAGIHPVGRLDVDSTGALLLTNDGRLTHWLTHPSHDWSKTYRVWVQGRPSLTMLDGWRQGVDLDGQTTRPAHVRVLNTSGANTELEIVLKEGRNRQIRRVAAQLGHPVLALHRIAIGNLGLGSLKPGQIRALTQSEVATLLAGLDHQFQPQPQQAAPPTAISSHYASSTNEN